MMSHTARSNVMATAVSLALGAIIYLSFPVLPGWLGAPLVFAALGLGLAFNCLVMKGLRVVDFLRAHLVTGFVVYGGLVASPTYEVDNRGLAFALLLIVGILMSIKGSTSVEREDSDDREAVSVQA